MELEVEQVESCFQSLPISGDVRHYCPVKGCDVVLYDYMALEDFEISQKAPPMMQICIMLHGAGEFGPADSDRTMSYRPGYTSIFHSERSASGKFLVERGESVRMTELRFDPVQIDKVVTSDPFNYQREAFEVFRRKCGEEDYWFALFPTVASIQRLAERMQACVLGRPHEEFQLASLSFEILGEIALMLERKSESTSGNSSPLSVRDRKKVVSAHKVMLEDLEITWSINALAAVVGLSENKLKRGFNELFGNSVYAYLQEHRMAAAAERISVGGDSITEIAMSVGYSSLSHFSKVFRRYYGVSPREFKNS